MTWPTRLNITMFLFFLRYNTIKKAGNKNVMGQFFYYFVFSHNLYQKLCFDLHGLVFSVCQVTVAELEQKNCI